MNDATVIGVIAGVAAILLFLHAFGRTKSASEEMLRMYEGLLHHSRDGKSEDGSSNI
ncbi:MAG: hypothetical protein U1D55_09280 [Phycisphaerae bacterium]